MGLPGISKEMDLKNVLAKKVRFAANLVRGVKNKIRSAAL
jgi:hypothetical protein